MLVVGGWYDAEDRFGPIRLKRSLDSLSTGTTATFVMGPWSHGGWSRGDGNVLGNLRWRYKTGPFYRDSVEYPFFAHYLAGAADPDLPGVLVYRTGGDRWDRYDTWPAPNAKPVSLYLHANAVLDHQLGESPAVDEDDPGGHGSDPLDRPRAEPARRDEHVFRRSD